MMNSLRLGCILSVIAGLAFSTFASAQSLPVITTPSNNATVHQGDFVTVTVVPPSGVTPLAIEVGFGDPFIGPLPVLTVPPYTFSVNVGTSDFGVKKLVAFMTLGNGQGVESNPVLLDVEPKTQPTVLSVNPKTIGFLYAGEAQTLFVTATFPDQSTGNVTTSSNIVYSSTNTSVAQVSSSGVVTATGPGSATIAITYGSVTSTVIVSVRSTLRGDLNGDGKVDIDDINILDSALNTPANGPNDARDLNHDGVINALDARILTTLCTYPHCATHQ